MFVFDLLLRVSNEGILRPRVARAQKIVSLHPLRLLRESEKGTGYFFLPRYYHLAYRAAAMLRPLGYSVGHAYHLLNRGNGGGIVFHTDSDYAAFLDLLGAAKARHPVQITASA